MKGRRRTTGPCRLVLLFFLASAACAEEPRIGRLLPADRVEAARAHILGGDEPFASAHRQLVERATRALEEAPSAPVEFRLPGFYENEAEHLRVKRTLRRDVNAAYDCALAAHLDLGLPVDLRTRCHAKARQLLNAWASTNRRILGSDTAVDQGELTMAVVGTAFLFAAERLDVDGAWPAQERRQFEAWTRDVFRPGAIHLMKRSNNKAAWGVFAALAADGFLQDRHGMTRRAVELERIMNEQIAASGFLPAEQRRDEKSLWYTYWALAPLSHAVELVRNGTGQDLYRWESPGGASLRSALAVFFRGAQFPKRWPTAIDDPAQANGWGGNLLYASGHALQVPAWIVWAGPPFGTRNSAWKSADLFPPKPSID